VGSVGVLGEEPKPRWWDTFLDRNSVTARRAGTLYTWSLHTQISVMSSRTIC